MKAAPAAKATPVELPKAKPVVKQVEKQVDLDQPQHEQAPEPVSMDEAQPAREAIAAAQERAIAARLQQQRVAAAAVAAARAHAHAQDDYKARIRAMLASRKHYPSRAVRYGLSGVVRIRFQITSEGVAMPAQVARSSGHRMLDDAAADLVARVGRLP